MRMREPSATREATPSCRYSSTIATCSFMPSATMHLQKLMEISRYYGFLSKSGLAS